jgi:hypothetical protein
MENIVKDGRQLMNGTEKRIIELQTTWNSLRSQIDELVLLAAAPVRRLGDAVGYDVDRLLDEPCGRCGERTCFGGCE